MPEQLDVEIALRDSISSGLRQVGREIDNITKNMREAAASGTDAFGKFGKGAKEAKDATDKTKDSVSGLSGFMTGMSRVLLGATGVAAGFIAVSEALGKFAQKRVQMEMLSIDLRMSNEQISIMRRALERMGADVGTQDRLLGTLGQKLHEVFTAGYYSPLIDHLSKMGGEGGTIQKLVESTKSGGDFFEATKIMLDRADEIKKRFGADSPQLKEFADAMGWPVSYLQGMNKGMSEVKSSYISSYQISQESLNSFREVEDAWSDMLTRVEEISMNVLIGMNKGFKDWLDRMKSTIDSIGESPAESQKRLPGYKPKQMGTFGLEDEGGLPPNKTLNSYVIEGMREEDKKTNRLLGDIADTLQTFERFGRGSGGGYTSRGGLGSGLDLGGVASGSGSSGGGGSGGSSRIDIPRAPLGPSRFGRPARVHSSTGGISQPQSQHTPIQTEQPLPGRGSGVMDRSRLVAEMQANPEMARRLQTIVQGEVGHGASDQRKKIQLETIFNRAIARDQTLAEVTQEYAGPGSKGYYPRSTFTGGRIRNEEEFRKFQENIMGPVAGGSDVSTDVLGFPATGNASGGVASRGIASGRYQRHGTLGGETYVWQENLKQQQRLLASRGGRSGGLSVGGDIDASDAVAFMRSRGGHDATLGKEAAPGINPELASRLAAAGQAYELETGKKANFGEMGRSKELQSVYYNKYLRGGNIAAKPGFSRHQRGEATDIPRGGFLSWLHAGGGEKHGVNFPVRGDPVHAQMDPAFRNNIDRSLQRKATTSSPKGNVKAEVDFSNMPSAQKKSGDELGKFKLLKITPAPQGAKDLEGLMTPGDLAHTPHVP